MAIKRYPNGRLLRRPRPLWTPTIRWSGAGGGGGAPSAMLGVDKQTASGKAEVDFFWDADLYSYVEFYGWGMKQTDDLHLDVRISTNGTSKRTDASGYSYSGRFWDGIGNTNLNNNGNADRIYNRLGSVGNESVHFVIKCFSISNSAMRLSWTSKGFGQDSSGNARTIHSGCVFQADSSKGRGVSFRTNGGANFSAGEIWAYFYQDPAA